MYSKIYMMVSGILMGIADSMPGVSGSTIAYIMGIYDTFIDAIEGMTQRKKRRQKLPILTKIFGGWMIGFLSSVLLISTIIENNVYFISSMFIGFTIISIPLTIKVELKSLKNFFPNIGLTILGILLVIGLMKINLLIPQQNFIAINFSIATYMYFILAGILAIGAMLLPGISGSSMLLILGIYYPILNGIKEILHLNFDYLGMLIAIGIGVLVGGVSFAKLFSNLFKNHRVASFYFIEGLLIGSLWPIILSPTTVLETNQLLNLGNFNFVGFILGVLVLLVLEFYRQSKSK